MRTFILFPSLFICFALGQTILLTDPPKSLDWREKCAVTPVKDQGSCYSSWAFAVNLVCCASDVLEGKGLVQVAITVTELLRFHAPRSPMHSAMSTVVAGMKHHERPECVTKLAPEQGSLLPDSYVNCGKRHGINVSDLISKHEVPRDTKMRTFILFPSLFICFALGQTILLTDPPKSLDWREKCAVTPVKDQGSCYSSWAFAVVESVEAAHFIKTGHLVTLSAQQMVDCSGFYGNNGCDSGYLRESMPYAAFEGLQSADSYPYTGQNQTCQYNKSQIMAKIDSWEYFYDNQYQLVQTLLNFGPVAASIDARELKNYTGGIYSSETCSLFNPTQGVLVVGYGSENGTDYWILKTSLGTSWGEQGYLRIAKKPNYLACGLLKQTVYPIIF